MTYSMTAFARKEYSFELGKLMIELRSVNHRYLDLSFRLSDTLRALEADFRTQIKNTLGRGKVDVCISLALIDKDVAPEINEKLAKSFVDLHRKLYASSPEIAPIDFLQLLKWPKMLEQKDLDIECVKDKILGYLDDCLQLFVEARAREGKALSDIILQRLETCRAHVITINKLYPQQIVLQKEKLQAKLAEALSEEIDRLTTHLNEFQRILSSKGQVGRRMDFLLQEMNREANTMASKAIDAKIQHTVVDIKVLLEQIREQVQNIE